MEKAKKDWIRGKIKSKRETGEGKVVNKLTKAKTLCQDSDTVLGRNCHWIWEEWANAKISDKLENWHDSCNNIR